MRQSYYLFIFLIVPAWLRCQVTDGLVAKYSFNDGFTNDEITGAVVKAVGASLVNDRFGNPRSAYFLHGNYQSYLNLGTDKRLKRRQLTISLWVNIDNIIHKGRGIYHNPVIITKSHGGNDFFEGYYMGLNMTTCRINANTAADSVQGAGVTSTDVFSLNKWHHLVMAFDDRYIWFYVDAVLQNDNKPMQKNFVSRYLAGDSVVLGTLANKKNDRCLNGTVDDIQIFKRVLSQKEVLELYQAPDPNKNQIYYTLFYRVAGVLLVIAVIVILIIRRYKKALRQEKEKNWIQMRLIELETKAIRTQMNPHFMFNSLNTLQRYILGDDMRGAQNYLSKFSKLLRKILESSTSDAIQLSEEIAILSSYIEIERLRFNDSFDYRLTSNIPEPEKCYIPFLLIQPFVENAIWHGLLPMSGNRFLSIDFSSPNEQVIFCVIEDNGVGREYSARQKDDLKKKSLALEFIAQRLQLLEKTTGIQCAFKIIDKKNETGESTGTRVEISIPKRNYR